MTGERPRYLAIDLARTAALAGMVVFHFCYDLEIFGWLPQGTVVTGWFWWQARIVAGSFIFLAGLGLWLAQGKGVRPRAFLHRLARIAAAAALVTLATRLAMPGLTIFYGILHSIAVSSVLGLLFLRLPAPVTVLAAAAVAILPQIWSNPALGGWLVWIGLSARFRSPRISSRSFPGSPPSSSASPPAGGCRISGSGRRSTGRRRRCCAVWPGPGQHSLAIYLIHQPVLFGAVFAFTWVWWRL
jgi:uncharacterized membrane protein